MTTVAWMTPDTRERANGLGYGRMQRQLRAAAIAAGLELRDDAPLAFYAEPPLRFTKRDDRPAVLLTMFESPTFPPSLRPHLHEADYLIVPSRWNVELFRPYVSCPIAVCNLGIDPAVFTPAPRTWRPGETFSWLHNGAPNGRKGMDVVEEAWARHFAHRADCELYVKTSAVDVPVAMEEAVACGWTAEAEGLCSMGNVIFDMRRLTVTDLVGLYHGADGFLFPTAGEGHGLTLHEAMATGLPAICTRYGGHLDFTSAATVRYVDYRMAPATLETTVDGQALQLEAALVEPDDLAAAMLDMMQHYRAAVKRARRGAFEVRALTWQRAGQRLVRILDDVTRQYGLQAA